MTIFILIHWSIGDGDEIIRVYAEKAEAVVSARAHAGPDYIEMSDVDLARARREQRSHAVFHLGHPKGYGGLRVEEREVYLSVITGPDANPIASSEGTS